LYSSLALDLGPNLTSPMAASHITTKAARPTQKPFFLRNSLSIFMVVYPWVQGLIVSSLRRRHRRHSATARRGRRPAAGRRPAGRLGGPQRVGGGRFPPDEEDDKLRAEMLGLVGGCFWLLFAADLAPSGHHGDRRALATAFGAALH